VAGGRGSPAGVPGTAASGVGLAGLILTAGTSANAQAQDRDEQKLLLHGSSEKTEVDKT
jgi:hypothetical protein